MTDRVFSPHLLVRLRTGSAWIAVLVAVAFTSGCCLSHGRPVEYYPGGGTSPSDDGNRGSGTFDEGVDAGRQDAEAANVAGHFVLGAITAPLIVICIVALLAGDGDSPNCGGGGNTVILAPGAVHTGGGYPPPRYMPHDSGNRSYAYIDGYNQGYEQRLNDRQGGAFAMGFVVGAVITAIGIGIYVADQNRRAGLEDEAGEHMTSGGRRPRGASLLEF